MKRQNPQQRRYNELCAAIGVLKPMFDRMAASAEEAVRHRTMRRADADSRRRAFELAVECLNDEIARIAADPPVVRGGAEPPDPAYHTAAMRASQGSLL